MSNFQFLQNEWPEIFKKVLEAEQAILLTPSVSAVVSRSVLEFMIRWLYAHDSDLTTPYDTKLSSLMYAQCFKDVLPENWVKFWK